MKIRLLSLIFFLTSLAAVEAQYEHLSVISSSWSMWSPWSFCSNNVMIRVRACSTVRGYKCIGRNKEFQSCNSPPPRRNNLDYEDPETADREAAMKQLYQDYEPETPDEARYTPQPHGNRNFHHIGPTTPTTTTARPAPTEDFSVMGRTGMGMSSEEFEYPDATVRRAPVPKPKPTNPSETTFEFDKYPKSTEEPVTTTTEMEEVVEEETTTTTEEPTTSTTTEEPTTTTEEPTTTTEEVTTTTEAPTTEEPLPQTVTPHYVVDEAVVESEDVGFRGKYTLEEPLPSVSQPAPPGTMEEPTSPPPSFPIDAEQEKEQESESQSESTHIIGSYSIGKEPTWEEEPEPLKTPEPESTRNPTIPKFSISPSASTRKSGEVRRPSTTATHIEMPMSMLPFLPTTVQEQTATVIPPRDYPKISLITSPQTMQKFPKMMNEQRAPTRLRTIQRHRVESPEVEEAQEDVTTTTTTKKPNKVTVEITNKTLKKKRRNRRLKKLNRLGRIRTVAVLPTDFPVPTEPMKVFESKTEQVFDETRELEARIAALRNKVEMNRKILETMRPTSTLPPLPPSPVMLEGDTARALSWMINDMERMIDEKKARTDVVDQMPVEKVVEEAPGFRLGEAEEDASTTTVSPFPFPIPEDGFALIRSRRSVGELKGSLKKVLWSSWSEWTECQCGKQSRKRKCLKQSQGSKYPYDDQTFIPIVKNQNQNTIEFGEPAEFPEDVEEPPALYSSSEDVHNRVKRFVKCAAPQVEVRSCHSLRC